MNNIYFQYWSVLITITSAIVMVAVSYATSRAELWLAQRADVQDFDKKKEDARRTRASWTKVDLAASGLVLACIAFAYLYFRG